jgi:hypothetical protein
MRRRIVPAGQGEGPAFKIAAVKRDPFKKEFIDLCATDFDMANIIGEGIEQSCSGYHRVSAIGRHAMERSEILKAQSCRLVRLVNAALGEQPQIQTQTRPQAVTSDAMEADDAEHTDTEHTDTDRIQAIAEKVRQYCELLSSNESLLLPAGSLLAPADSRCKEPTRGQKRTMMRRERYSSVLLMRDPWRLQSLLELGGESTIVREDDMIESRRDFDWLGLIPRRDDEGSEPGSEDEGESLDLQTNAFAHESETDFMDETVVQQQEIGITGGRVVQDDTDDAGCSVAENRPAADKNPGHAESDLAELQTPQKESRDEPAAQPLKPKKPTDKKTPKQISQFSHLIDLSNRSSNSDTKREKSSLRRKVRWDLFLRQR